MPSFDLAGAIRFWELGFQGSNIHERSRVNFERLLAGESTLLAGGYHGDFGAAIDTSGQLYALKRGWEPALAGWWMDWPEEHWNLTEEEYLALPRQKRARLEAMEQAVKWVPGQFYMLWLGTYVPPPAGYKGWIEFGEAGWDDVFTKESQERFRVLAHRERTALLLGGNGG
ncbi:MAG: hypothetical protein Q8R28_14975 [Dehalococcoidia bacterium]|nr:hypothetical protein [Dehalococcoidia bacterium]